MGRSDCGARASLLTCKPLAPASGASGCRPRATTMGIGRSGSTGRAVGRLPRSGARVFCRLNIQVAEGRQVVLSAHLPEKPSKLAPLLFQCVSVLLQAMKLPSAELECERVPQCPAQFFQRLVMKEKSRVVCIFHPSLNHLRCVRDHLQTLSNIFRAAMLLTGIVTSPPATCLESRSVSCEMR